MRAADRLRHQTIEHDPEKWIPVSRRAKPKRRYVVSFDASAGVAGRKRGAQTMS
jgi:hypothetical protein